MANLIIKPTSGGSLILQDEGGTAAHTIDASGNHTLSGTTNNIGTVTAGSIAGGSITSATTFPTGHVLQTLYDIDATSQVLATSTYTDTDLSIAITPSSTSNKIFALWTMVAEIGANEGFGTRLLRNSTTAFTSNQVYHAYMSAAGRLNLTSMHLDSPSSTSSITYKIQVGSYGGNSITLNDGTNQSFLTLMEIAG